MTPAEFVDYLSSIRFENTFNPYAQRCPVHDREDAIELRQATLLEMLEIAAKSEIDSIWIGRDLGYRGGRRTGLALTDDAHLKTHTDRWGISTPRPTASEVVSERTATVIWGVLSKIEPLIFLWNVFPFHPHEPEKPFSNRSHKASERLVGEEILSNLISIIEPTRVVAIGNDAEKAALRLVEKSKVFKVRHPSYGGQTQFISEVHSLYSLPMPSQPKQRKLF